MVTFRLKEQDEEKLIYWYYPEGNETRAPGIIKADLLKKEIEIVKLAEDDWERDVPPEELNELAIAINNMKREAGKTDFVEMVTEPEHCIKYGDHAVREIANRIINGDIPEHGMQAWY